MAEPQIPFACARGPVIQASGRWDSYCLSLTTWALGKARVSMKVYAGFTSAVALTDGVGDNIPTANITGAVNGGAAAPFTGASGPIASNNAITVFSQVVGAVGTFNSTHSDSVALQINTTGLALPAGTYTGTLTIQAQAI